MKTNNTVEKGPRWMFTWIVDSTNSDSSVVSSLLDTQVWMGRLKYYVYHLEMDAVSGRLQYVGYTEWNDRVTLLSVKRSISGSDHSPIVVERCPSNDDSMLSRLGDSANIYRIGGPWRGGIRIRRGRPSKSMNVEKISRDIEGMVNSGMTNIEIYRKIESTISNYYYKTKAYDLVDKIRLKYAKTV